MKLHNLQYKFSFFSSLINATPDEEFWDTNKLIEAVWQNGELIGGVRK